MTLSSVNASFSFLLICQSYFPVLGGSEIEAQRVSSALIRRGHRLTVVCAGGDLMPAVKEWIDPEGVPVRIYAHCRDGAVKNVIYALRVAGILIRERENYQFVYFLMQGLHLAVGLPVAHLLNKPVFVKISGSGQVTRMSKSRIGRLELRWLNRWAKKVLILNEGMRAEAIQGGISAEKLQLMPNPVDTEEFSPANNEAQRKLREQSGIPQEVPVIAYSGRLAPEKSLPTVVDAFALVLEVVPDALLVLVGDGSMRDSLVQHAQQLGLGEQNIRFTGRVGPHEVSQWLKIATVFALVSSFEGFPCALEEAMSTGLPSVVTDIPGNRQLVEDGRQALMAPVGDTKRIAECLVLLLKNAKLREQMANAARQHILENYSTQHVVELYEKLFKEITAE
jgi:glycosyltransferase involved in cell wall biosynthesis